MTLTEKGQKSAKNSYGKMQEKLIHVFEQMGEEDTKKFIELMEKFMTY